MQAIHGALWMHGTSRAHTISSLVTGQITSRERMAMLAAALREAGLPE